MLSRKSIWYVYPFFKHVSWNSIGVHHVAQLRQWFRVEEIDELAFPFIHIVGNPVVFLHPYFYPFQKLERNLSLKVPKFSALIGIDVADSNQISKYAVKLTQYATALIVPSNWARQSYIKSGVKKPVYVLPHGVTPEWIDTPPQPPSTFQHLAKLKKEENRILLLSYIVHSPYRKGFDLLVEIYRRTLAERNNVLLVLKTGAGVGYFPEYVKDGKYEMKGQVYSGWLTDQQKMELFDLCDVFLLTSRGGGFEHPALEGLARGIPVIGAKGGAWEDFLPKWSLVDSQPSKQVLEGNPIHVGIGVEMKIEKAVDRLIHIIDNLDDYKARAKEYAETTIKEKFTWNKIGEQLRDILLQYL